MNFSPEQLSELERLKGMTPDALVQMAEENAQKLELEGKTQQAQALRMLVQKRRGPAAQMGGGIPHAPRQPQPVPSVARAVRTGTPRTEQELRRPYAAPAVEDIGTRQAFITLQASNSELQRRVDVLSTDLAEVRRALTTTLLELKETRELTQKLSDAWTK